MAQRTSFVSPRRDRYGFDYAPQATTFHEMGELYVACFLSGRNRAISLKLLLISSTTLRTAANRRQ